MSNLDKNSAVQESGPVLQFRDAYEHLLDEIQQVPSSDLVPINIDIPVAVTTALGAIPEIRAMRPRIEAEIPKFDLQRLDKLETYTQAVGHAHALYMTAISPTEPLPELAAQAAKLREQIVSDALALAKRGLIDGQRLKELNGPVGYRNVAFDLLALSPILRDSWSKISGKSAIQIEELDQAETLAARLLNAVGLREQSPAVVAATAEMRQKAFALFAGTYDQARRAIGFLRWDEDDVDTIAPSLYANRHAAKRKNGPDVQPTPVPNPTPAPGPVVATHTLTSNGDTLQGTGSAAVGLPGSSPYAH